MVYLAGNPGHRFDGTLSLPAYSHRGAGPGRARSALSLPKRPAEEPAEPAAPADPWAEVDPSGQTVIFWHQHSRAREEALLQIVDEFNQSNEWGITVEASYQGSYNDIFNKMLAVLNTSDAPNVVVAYQNQAATYQIVRWSGRYELPG